MTTNKPCQRPRVKLSLLGRSVLVFATLLVGLIPASAFAKITKGPVLLRAEQRRAAFMFESDTKGRGKVSYGKSEQLENEIATEPIVIEYEIQEGAERGLRGIAFVHKLWIEGLEAGQVYSYRAAGPEDESKIFSFRTQPVETDEVRFIVYGDSRTYPETARRVVERMIERKVDFIVNVGDLVQKGGRYEDWGPQFFEPLKGLAESVPVYVAKGNHDIGEPNYFEKFLIPAGEKNGYGFSYGPVNYFCADNMSKNVNAKELLNQISADARDSKARWKFVSYHKPSLNFSGHWSSWGGTDALAALAGAGVDFVLAGHSHIYERFRPVAPPCGTAGSFVTYITTGGGGAELHKLWSSDYHAHARRVHHFCLFSIKANKLTMDIIDINGETIDHLEITKANGQLNKQYLQTAVPMEAIRLHQDLYEALKRPLAAKPQRNQPFVVSFKLSVPPLGNPGNVTFKLRCDEGTYQLPGPRRVALPKEGGKIELELTATPLVEVEVPRHKWRKKMPIEPALWTDCHYRIGQIAQDLNLAVEAKSKPKKRPKTQY